MANLVRLTQGSDYVFRSADDTITATFTTCGEFGNCSALSLVTLRGEYLIPSTHIGNHHPGPAVYRGYAGKFAVTLTPPKVGFMDLSW